MDIPEDHSIDPDSENRRQVRLPANDPLRKSATQAVDAATKALTMPVRAAMDSMAKGILDPVALGLAPTIKVQTGVLDSIAKTVTDATAMKFALNPDISTRLRSPALDAASKMVSDAAERNAMIANTFRSPALDAATKLTGLGGVKYDLPAMNLGGAQGVVDSMKSIVGEGEAARARLEAAFAPTPMPELPFETYELPPRPEARTASLMGDVVELLENLGDSIDRMAAGVGTLGELQLEAERKHEQERLEAEKKHELERVGAEKKAAKRHRDILIATIAGALGAIGAVVATVLVAS